MVPVSLVWVACCKFILVPLSQYVILVQPRWQVFPREAAFSLTRFVIRPENGCRPAERIHVNHHPTREAKNCPTASNMEMAVCPNVLTTSLAALGQKATKNTTNAIPAQTSTFFNTIVSTL